MCSSLGTSSVFSHSRVRTYLISTTLSEEGKEELLDAEQWISVLKLADMYNFATSRKQAVRQREPLLHDKPALRVALATRYDIKEWLLPALTTLVQREEPLGMEDYQYLGLETIIKLGGVREKYSAHCTGCPIGKP